jgi:hypothetical protein
MRIYLAATAAALAVALAPATASASMPLRNAGEIQTFQARYGLSQTGVMDSATEACAHLWLGGEGIQQLGWHYLIVTVVQHIIGRLRWE